MNNFQVIFFGSIFLIYTVGMLLCYFGLPTLIRKVSCACGNTWWFLKCKKCHPETKAKISTDIAKQYATLDINKSEKASRQYLLYRLEKLQEDMHKQSVYEFEHCNILKSNTYGLAAGKVAKLIRQINVKEENWFRINF